MWRFRVDISNTSIILTRLQLKNLFWNVFWFQNVPVYILKLSQMYFLKWITSKFWNLAHFYKENFWWSSFYTNHTMFPFFYSYIPCSKNIPPKIDKMRVSLIGNHALRHCRISIWNEYCIVSFTMSLLFLADSHQTIWILMLYCLIYRSHRRTIFFSHHSQTKKKKIKIKYHQ